MFDDSHSITEADGEVSVVAVADSTQLSDEAECSDASSSQLDDEAQPGSGCGHGKLPSGYDCAGHPSSINLVEIYSMTLQEAGLLAGFVLIDKYCYWTMYEN